MDKCLKSNCQFQPGEISVAWYVSSDQFVQECSVATSPLSAVSRAGPIDSVASFSFWVVGVMVMLAGQVLGSAVFCVEITTYKNKFNSIKNKRALK